MVKGERGEKKYVGPLVFFSSKMDGKLVDQSFARGPRQKHMTGLSIDVKRLKGNLIYFKIII